MPDKLLQIVNGRVTEVEALAASAGSGDAGKIPALGSDGRLDASFLPVGIGADVQVIEATEGLAAGQFVNVYNDDGPRVRLADASVAAAARRATGYVLDNVTSGNPATVYPLTGRNDELSGLTPGVTYVLSNATPGGLLPLTSAPTTPGHILQIVGEAVATDTLLVNIQPPVVRA